MQGKANFWNFLLLLQLSACLSCYALVPHEYLSARDRCMQRERVPVDYVQRFNRFQYPDESVVHRYLHCVWTDLGMWHDGSGFDAQHIVNAYGGERTINDEIAIPEISACNQRTAKPNVSQTKWCYDAFICILRSPVGGWYRRKAADIINGNYR